MRALWLENGDLRFRDDLPRPERTETTEAIVRVRLAGICGTDLGLLDGYYPFSGIPGHEFVGEVVDADTAALIGRRVVGEINIGCGFCAECRTSGPRHCAQRQALGISGRSGAFAEFLMLPMANLHRVPDEISDEAAVFTEPLAAALAIQEQVGVGPHQRVLLIGAGRLGQLIAQTLALTGCDLSVVARHPVQQRLLAGRGIRWFSEARLPAGLFDIVVEATGSPGGFHLARDFLRPKGTLVLKSTYRDRVTVDLSSLVVDELRMIGSRCGPFPAALRLLAAGMVDPTPMIAATYPLSRGAEAFRQARSGERPKILLAPSFHSNA